KEALSADTEVTIPVLAPGIQSQVRLVRAEFEDLIRPQVAETVDALRRALQSADVGPEDLDVVLLVGGSSRVPLVAQLVSAELGRPVAVDADPTAAIALGAALSALPTATAESDPVSADVPADTLVLAASADRTVTIATLPGPDAPERSQVEVPHRPTLAAAPSGIEPADLERQRARSRKVKQVAAAGLLALVIVGGATAVPYLSSRSGPIPPADAGTPVEMDAGTPVDAGVPPPASVPTPDAGSAGDQNSRSGVSREAVRTTPTAAPAAGAGTEARANGHTTAPPTTWTSSWATSWSNPPAPHSDPNTGGSTTPPNTTTPSTGSTTTPNTGGSTAPNTGSSTTPNTGSSTKPGAGSGTTPDDGDGTAPNTGSNTTPNTGDNTTPNTGDNTTPNTGDNTTPDDGAVTAPNTGSGTGSSDDGSGTPSPPS
ncbi:MAG: Hsp70 family protein, partial [Pseudonocardiaceae bacterium]